MEVNKDEAERCIELAEQCILEGKRDKAERFLLKSEKLYSTQKARDLLESLKKFKSATDPSSDGDCRNRRPTQSQGAKRERSASRAPDYTTEQLEAVKRVKKCKDYYEILGVNKEATDSEIKKAYKKLALNLHPDKNHAPGASEAFKAIGNAVAILTDPEKRKQYDMFGSSDERLRSRGSHSETFTRGFESDITSEELFNMFFGSGAFTGSNVYVRRGNQWRRADQPSSQQTHRESTTNYGVLMQMLPVLILIALSMMSSLLVSDPVYSLTQNNKFSVLRHTATLKVPYYVKDNFQDTYQGSLRRLEVSVEEEYIMNLRNACYREKNYRETLLWRAKNWGDNSLFVRAQGMKTPSCDTLHEISARA